MSARVARKETVVEGRRDPETVDGKTGDNQRQGGRMGGGKSKRASAEFPLLTQTISAVGGSGREVAGGIPRSRKCTRLLSGSDDVGKTGTQGGWGDVVTR